MNVRVSNVPHVSSHASFSACFAGGGFWHFRSGLFGDLDRNETKDLRWVLDYWQRTQRNNGMDGFRRPQRSSAFLPEAIQRARTLRGVRFSLLRPLAYPAWHDAISRNGSCIRQRRQGRTLDRSCRQKATSWPSLLTSSRQESMSMCIWPIMITRRADLN